MGIMHIPYNPATDPKALFAQGIQNLVAGLVEANQAKIEGREIQRLIGALPADHPLRVALSQGPIRSPAVRQAIMGGLGQSLLNPFATQQAEATLGYTKARTEAFKQSSNKIIDTPLSEPQVAAYGEAMDSRIKNAGKWGRWGPNYTDKKLFQEWQKFCGIYKFKNDTQKEQAWNVWKNKVNNKGDDVDWDPTDPKWRAAIGLKGSELRSTKDEGEIGADSIKMQSAPDIKLNKYWPNMSEEEKRTAWQYYESGGNIEEIIRLLESTLTKPGLGAVKPPAEGELDVFEKLMPKKIFRGKGYTGTW